MLVSEIKNKVKESGLEINKPKKQVYDYVFNKTKSRERALIPANRYNNLYHIQKFESNKLSYILSKKFISRLPDVDKASEIIDKHIKNNSRIYQVIDYDVDGITSGAIGFLIFKDIFKYKKFKIIVNNRSWKNGINDTIVNTILEEHNKKKIGLVITSDHGSSDGSRIKILKEAGIDVIVTDHHLPSETNSPLGIADAFVNYKRSDSIFTNDITGTVVLYFTYLYYYLDKLKYNKEDIDKFYNLIPYLMLTTISDSVDMSDWANRKLTIAGLNMLNSKRKLTSFWEVVRDQIFQSWFIDQEFISFNLIAKLNSPGRIDDPTLSFKLMIASNYHKAEELLKEIEVINTKRKRLQNIAMNNLDIELTNKDITVAYKENITGIQGILAAKLLFKNNSNIAFCFTNEGDNTLSGSARSINKSVSLIEVLNKLKNKDYIIKYGGHALACGLEIKKEGLKEFYNDLIEILKTEKPSKTHFNIDDIITDDKILYKTFIANYTELPYGQNYPQPLYVSKFRLVDNKLIKRNGNYFLVGGVKLITDKGVSKNYYKLLYTIENEDEIELLKNSKNKDIYIVYNIGLNKYRENVLNITAKKIYCA